MQKQSAEALASFMRRKEAVIIDSLPVIVTAMPYAEMKMELKAHGTCKRLPDGTEIWGYKGKDFLQLGPPEYETVNKRGSITVTVSQSVLRLPLN